MASLPPPAAAHDRGHLADHRPGREPGLHGPGGEVGDQHGLAVGRGAQHHGGPVAQALLHAVGDREQLVHVDRLHLGGHGAHGPGLHGGRPRSRSRRPGPTWPGAARPRAPRMRSSRWARSASRRALAVAQPLDRGGSGEGLDATRAGARRRLAGDRERARSRPCATRGCRRTAPSRSRRWTARARAPRTSPRTGPMAPWSAASSRLTISQLTGWSSATRALTIRSISSRVSGGTRPGG